MGMFDRFRGVEPKPQKLQEDSQLLSILEKVKADKKIYAEICKILAERDPQKFKNESEAKRYIDTATTVADAFSVAKLIDLSLGEGAFRTLSFLDKKQDSSKSVLKLLKNNFESNSFEKQVEKGHYLNLLESYGVSWDIEKVSRDILQNFFDANGQTLDGVSIKVTTEEKMDPKTNTKVKNCKVIVTAPQDYDWRELIHFGGTTKTDSDTSVGGFGEGLKIASFVLLKELGATRVKAASQDWELEYYFDDVSAEAYRKEIKGLYAQKKKTEKKPGNSVEIVFEGNDADKRAQVFEQAPELFYSSKNPDYQSPSFDNKASGGFKILAPKDNPRTWSRRQKGRLYLAGQRIHYDDRSEWNNVNDLNVWTWKKVQPKDRDRGMITRSEMEKMVLPLIVESMTLEERKKSVYDFKELWVEISHYETSYQLLEMIVKKLVEVSTNLEFEPQYLSNDWAFMPGWIREGLQSKGFKICPGFFKGVGMMGVREQFQNWMNHSRVEATAVETQKISVLKKASQALGLGEDELKDVWIFSKEGEKSIVHGQYNSEFYWMAQEALVGSFLDALHTYVHEAAHKEGPHGEAKFDYALQDRIQRIQRFILEHKPEWDEFEKEWAASGK